MTRRLRYVPVSAAILMSLMKKGQEHITVELIANELPADTTLVRMGHDDFGQINLVVESIDFDEVQDGDEIPRHPTPLFRQVSTASRTPDLMSRLRPVCSTGEQLLD